ncbi:MAG TPA: bifunctional [glutamine synthetase] adenylyltransferase/[glutamine synthetase]-adenylyl-L-tyrosine phosphorylase [Corynebacteriales bacterium]|nr:bifunctional [glutamine synthetase] adenylyltransferase/[glutamine synthetase]-adenylyl-L-tyrosine phosphorylase [Mycobacteriales bacterium]
MNSLSPTPRKKLPSAARLGITRDNAETELGHLGWKNEESRVLLTALSRSPDPNLCLVACLRLRDEVGEKAWERITAELIDDPVRRSRLLALLGSSTALGDHLITHPRMVDRIGDEVPTEAGMFSYMLGAISARPLDESATADLTTPGTYYSGVHSSQAISKLRRAYLDIMLLIAADDLAQTVDPEVPVPSRRVTSEKLSSLADAALTAALAVATTIVYPDPQDYDTQLAIIAMGKCGANELNYVSDIDVIFVAEPADQKTARLAGEVIRIGTMAFCEIDAALRPEGKKGDLVRTVGSHLNYYRRWAKTWEFQALLKARPMTGDMALGQEYFDAIYPMVWTACERGEFVEDVQKMRKRVEDNLPLEQTARELKLGDGGLRDVEFAVQLLQMVHGRTDEKLRTRSTGEALDVLASHGYISRKDGKELNEVYDFLRLLEHRLQLQQLRRTHLLPPLDNEDALRWLARAAGIKAQGIDDSWEVLLADLKKARSRARTLHEKLFYRPLLHSIAEADAAAVRLDDDAIGRQLSALGYRNPRHAVTHLRALTKTRSRRSRIQAVILPAVLEKLSRTPNPDGGLLDYRRLCEKLSSKTWFLRLLRDDGVVLERLAMICGCSRYVPDVLMKAPEVIQLLSGKKLLKTEPQEIASALRASAARYDDPEEAIDIARSLRRAELARIACADILGMMDVEEVCAALSTIWVAVLDAGLEVVQRHKLTQQGLTVEDAPARIAVIGMGRLGGMEIGYGSDADVMFVCEPTEKAADKQSSLKWAEEVIDKLQSLLKRPSTDPSLEIDVDLRPEGKKGALVRSLASYQKYYEQWAEPWELQALLRAKPLAGDMELGERFIDVINPLRYPKKVSRQTVQQIQRMKIRVEEERMPRGVDPKLHTKLGRGSLSDIEWTLQLLQLEHAAEIPALQVTSTRAALEAATEAGLISLDDEDTLWIAWSRATATRNALVLAKGRTLDVLPIQGEILGSVAVICGWPLHSGSEYVENYLKSTRRARNVVEKVFWGEK